MIEAGLKFLPLIGEMCEGKVSDLTLAGLARRAGLSESYLQRRFTSFAGESPKKYSQRVRLERAAADLLATDASILDIALDAGFASHEVFTRAFRREFGRSPKQFRMQMRMRQDHRPRYRKIIRSVSPCIRLYGISLAKYQEQQKMPTPPIERRELKDQQPILFIQRRIPVNQLQQTMGECFGALFGYGQQAGLPIAGPPVSRYVSTGTGLWTVDFVMPLLQPAEPNGEMKAGLLVSGPVAFSVHKGPYDRLSETYAAIEHWIDENGYAAASPPWDPMSLTRQKRRILPTGGLKYFGL